MITKAQALNASGDVHETGCLIEVGPRGGTKERIVRWRIAGACRTWKTDPQRFELPIKYGLKTWSAVTQYTAEDFHLASECPLVQS